MITNRYEYLYELIEDYRDADSEAEKGQLLKSFCSSVWSNENKRRGISKTIRFSVRKDLLNTEVGQVFGAWSEIRYQGYQSKSKETDWSSLLRQKVNNLYSRYFDKKIILQKDYLDLLRTPKRLYFQWIGGADMEPDLLAATLSAAASEAQRLCVVYQKQKMELSWCEYKKIMEGFFHKILDNCRPPEVYGGSAIYDFMTEDNFYIRYFCKSLEGEMLKWQKQYYGIRDHRKYKRCRLCGALIEDTGNRKMYCSACARQNERVNAAARKRRQRDMSRNRNS